uniref:Uncharacterized protein n=1 Tax=Oryza sativa subsp. japonica TaxID=39947 RepID=Q69SN2_ORYSJ|nr:hypothetical protein [Oryza sativa Japonica Group]
MAAAGDHRGMGAASRRPRRRGRLRARRVAASWGPAVSRPCSQTLQLRKIRSTWRLKPTLGKASKASHIILEHIES